MDSDALYDLLHKALTYFDLWPFVGPRPITMDAELFFQFLREVQRRRHTDEHGYVMPPADGRNGTEGTDSTPHPSPVASQARHEMGALSRETASRNVVPGRGGEPEPGLPITRPTTTDFGKSSGVSPAVAREACAFPETEQTKQTEQ